MRLWVKLLSRRAADLMEYSLIDAQSSPSIHKRFQIVVAVKNILEIRKTLSHADLVRLKNMIPAAGFGYQAFCVLMEKDSGLSAIRNLITAFEQSNSMNPVLKAQFLSAFDVYRNDCTEQDIKFVEGAIDEALTKFPVITKDLGNYLIKGLPAIPSWEEKRDLIMSKLGDKADHHSYGNLALAALTHRDFEQAWSYLHKAAQTGKEIHPKVFSRLLSCHEENPGEDLLFKLLTFIEERNIMLSLGVAKHVASIIENTEDWVARFLHLKPSGRCDVCKTTLKKLPLNSQEHMMLLDNVEKTFDLDCEFTTYQRQEFAEFQTFLKHCPPYSIVLDGLNMLYRGDYHQWMKVRTMLEKDGRKILIICRQHMKQQVKFKAAFAGHMFYYTQDSTMDDAFVIYAALFSGQETIVVSNDYYGTYFTKMVGENRGLFRRWQLSNHAVGVGHQSLQIVFPKFTPICQKSDDKSAIHVPLVPDKHFRIFSPLGWLCLHRVSKEQKEKASTLWPERDFELLQKTVGASFRMHATQVKQDTSRRPKVMRNLAG